MYCQSFFVISVRGIGDVPTTWPSWSLGCIAFMKAAFGVRLAPDFLADDFRADFFADDFLAVEPRFADDDFFALEPRFADDFFADDFFFAVAIESVSLVGEKRAVVEACAGYARLRLHRDCGEQSTAVMGGRKSESTIFSYENPSFSPDSCFLVPMVGPSERPARGVRKQESGTAPTPHLTAAPARA
jgi:hypothetical protein